MTEEEYEEITWDDHVNFAAFVLKGSKPCIAIDQIPSKECDEYHKNSKIQFNIQNNPFLREARECFIRNEDD